MDKLAKLTGYTTGSASVTLGKIKRKMKQHAEGASPISTPRKHTAGTKKRGPAGRDEETPRKKKAAKRYDSDDEEEFKHVKVKKEERDELLHGAGQYFQQQEGYQAQGHGGYYDDGVHGNGVYGVPAQQAHYQEEEDDAV
jgi:hypothetical protein